MDEAFITKALQEVGEDNVVSVKVIFALEINMKIVAYVYNLRIAI